MDRMSNLVKESIPSNIRISWTLNVVSVHVHMVWVFIISLIKIPNLQSLFSCSLCRICGPDWFKTHILNYLVF